MLPGRPGSGLLVTNRKGFGGGKNVGGSGGASELIEFSVGASGLFQSAVLLKLDVCDLLELYNCENFLKKKQIVSRHEGL